MKKFLVLLGAWTLLALIANACDDSNNQKNNHTNNTNNINNTNNTNNTNNINNTNNATCGDNQIQSPELCDGSQLAGATCESLGYTGGTLACANGCQSYDTSGCTGEPGPYGFFIRRPQMHELPCTSNTLSFRDEDHICTFADGNVTAVLYFQATPTACVEQFFEMPVYATTAWISISDSVQLLPAAEYDFGGNHHNDFFKFTFSGKKYAYFHSSFGYGFRSCQPMDCMQKLDDGGQVAEDGCTPERTLPVTCRRIADDGTFEALIDDFEKCPGDPNAK